MNIPSMQTTAEPRLGGTGWTPLLRRRVLAVPEPQAILAGAIQEGGYALRPAPLFERDLQEARDGFASEILWPLFHEQPLPSRFDPRCWQAYRRLNRKLARAVACTISRSDLLWVHNHLLMSLAAELRTLGVSCRSAFFLHLPFPAPDLFLKLPWRERLLLGLLAYDQIGFQTLRDLKNFLDCARTFGATVRQEDGLWTVRGETRRGAFELRAGAFPIGIDFQDVAERAARPEVTAAAARLRALHPGRKLVLGIDRLDRCKGIPEKLHAFAELLRRHPGLHEQVSLLQVVVPSREELLRHMELRREIERLVGEINGRFSRPGWVPVHYHQRTLGPEELLAHYRAADVALITPLREGMSLVAKEYCAADLDERGVLVLSEFAGAAAQLAPGALLVNPHDTVATARSLFRALRMKERDRSARMRSLRAIVRRYDVLGWAESFLAAALDERPAALLHLEPDLP